MPAAISLLPRATLVGAGSGAGVVGAGVGMLVGLAAYPPMAAGAPWACRRAGHSHRPLDLAATCPVGVLGAGRGGCQVQLLRWASW